MAEHGFSANDIALRSGNICLRPQRRIQAWACASDYGLVYIALHDKIELVALSLVLGEPHSEILDLPLTYMPTVRSWICP